MPSCAARERNSEMSDERPEIADFERVLRALHAAGVEFILIGGLAAVVWGASRFTRDMDIVYRRTPENLRRLVDALAPFAPYPRDAPPNLPFRWDATTLQRGLNFTLSTNAGPIDLFGEVVGGGVYDTLREAAVEIEVFGVPCLCVGLRKLIELKRAAGRPRDFEVIAELEQLADHADDSSGEGTSTTKSGEIGSPHVQGEP
jgi:predicted nucleotidyltransferase